MDNRSLSGSVTDERAYALRRRYHDRFRAPTFPIPVEAIAEDLLGLAVERVSIECSGMLFPVPMGPATDLDHA